MTTTTGANPGVPDLRYGEAEDDLRAAVRSLLTDRCPAAAVLARTESGEPYDTGTWRALAADLGCAGLLIPERHGGAGASYREAAVVAEETGRGTVPVPYLGSAVVATAALLPSGDQLLAGLAGGSVTAALAVPFTTMPPVTTPVTALASGVRAAAPGPGGEAGQARLTGTVAGVADALPAGVLLVPADGTDGPAGPGAVPSGLYAVDPGGPEVTVSPVVSLDSTRQLADVTFADATARPVSTGEAAARAVAAALTAGAAMLASEQLGVTERCLEMTVAYASERRQFGRAVGSFQAVKHRLADVWVAVTQARAAARYAAACLAEGSPDVPVAVALAKSACGEAALHAAQECVQLHGGIGFTWEHPAHLLLKRARSGAAGFGTPDRHRAVLAGLVNLPPAPR